MRNHLPLVLTFSASDPTCGAGLQADALTIAALGAHPLSILTGWTSQNTQGVEHFTPLPGKAVASQFDVLYNDTLAPHAIKAGVLGSLSALRCVLRACELYPGAPLVVDPVRGSGRGDALGTDTLFKAMRDELFAHTRVLTPNWPEAKAFTGADTPAQAAVALLETGCGAVLIKGEHLDEADVINRLYLADGGVREFTCTRLPGQYHGSGCTLASAIAVGLARGLDVEEAVEVGLDYTWLALKAAHVAGQGQLLPDRLHWMRDLHAQP